MRYRSFVLALLISAFCTPIQAAPKADPWPLWQASTTSSAAVDHQLWGQLLAQYVKPADLGNRFAYGAVNDADRHRLEGYLSSLQAIDPRDFNRDEQLAYWINLYNARTVALVLDNYPVESIREISFGLFSFGPWDEPLVEIAGVPLSLNDIEHRIIRPLWQEPRTHYLLNCASLGCPDLWPEPVEAERLEAQLEAAAHRFINQPKGVDQQGLRYSSIYAWFSEDFGEQTGVKAHLIQYAEPELKSWLEINFNLLDDDYDWRLNRMH